MSAGLTFNQAMHQTIEQIKDTDIFGCITGSSLIEDDYDTWAIKPDIDIFVYSQFAFIDAINVIKYKLGFSPLSKGEEWKINSSIKNGYIPKATNMITVKLSKDIDGNEIIVNITYHKNYHHIHDVLGNFDMTIIMKGWNIPSHTEIDFTTLWTEHNKVAIPNPLREVDFDLYTVEKWIRQYDRIIKYWDRGYDTRPMAHFYIDAINRVLEDGALFTSEKALSAFDEASASFTAIRDTLLTWLADKENI